MSDAAPDPGVEEAEEVPHSLRPRKPRTLGGLVYLAVLAGTVAGLTLVVLDRWRAGLVGVGISLLVGALGRLVLRDESAGMLGIRRKFVDVTTLTVLGTAIVVLALLIPDRAS